MAFSLISPSSDFSAFCFFILFDLLIWQPSSRGQREKNDALQLLDYEWFDPHYGSGSSTSLFFQKSGRRTGNLSFYHGAAGGEYFGVVVKNAGDRDPLRAYFHHSHRSQ